MAEERKRRFDAEVGLKDWFDVMCQQECDSISANIKTRLAKPVTYKDYLFSIAGPAEVVASVSAELAGLYPEHLFYKKDPYSSWIIVAADKGVDSPGGEFKLLLYRQK